jgi:hypothetical protein
VGKVEQYSPLKCEENITNISFDSGLKLEWPRFPYLHSSSEFTYQNLNKLYSSKICLCMDTPMWPPPRSRHKTFSLFQKVPYTILPNVHFTDNYYFNINYYRLVLLILETAYKWSNTVWVFCVSEFFFQLNGFLANSCCCVYL